MAKKFIVLAMPRDEIQENKEDWTSQLVDLIETTTCWEKVKQFPAATLVRKSKDQDSWTVAVCPKISSTEIKFYTSGMDCGGFSSSGAFILNYDVPDSIVLVASEDLDAFQEICRSAEIEVELVPMLVEA